MSKLKILFLAADPLSAAPNGPGPLRLEDDIREILEAIREAEHRDRLDFIPRTAVRPRDVLRALNQIRPQIVHFSGHGSLDGLCTWNPEGDGPHTIPPEALVRMFGGFHECVQLVVLSACYSQPQAMAIANVVGCAIGTPGQIADTAAINFNGAFYGAIAYGRSVAEAHEQACSLLHAEGYDLEMLPKLHARPGLDPARLFLVGPDGRAIRRSRLAAWRAPIAGLLIAGGISLVFDPPCQPEPPACQNAGAQQALGAAWLHAGASAGQTGTAATPDAQLACAVALSRAGDHEAAFPIFERIATAGDPRAMGYLGIAYLHGWGTTQQLSVGIHWLRTGAGKGDAYAMNSLAAAYLTGLGVARRAYLARHWYLSAATKKRDTEAMRGLGSLYREAQKYDSAFAWYGKAATAGSQDARVDIGEMYEEGLGTPRDLAMARRLYTTAADSGCARGMFALGLMHERGSGGPRDYVKARDWYRKAADAGSADAMNNLGVLYQNGWGVPEDLGMAIHLFRRARDAGSVAAPANLHAVGAS
jgi:TPR repeat protein